MSRTRPRFQLPQHCCWTPHGIGAGGVTCRRVHDSPSACCCVLQVPRDIRLLPHRLPKPDYGAEDLAGVPTAPPAAPAAARSPSPSSGAIRGPSPGAGAAVRSPSPGAAGGARSPSPGGCVVRSPSPGAGGVGARPASAVRAGAAAGESGGGGLCGPRVQFDQLRTEACWRCKNQEPARSSTAPKRNNVPATCQCCRDGAL
jgi:hypothetical protein